MALSRPALTSLHQVRFLSLSVASRRADLASPGESLFHYPAHLSLSSADYYVRDRLLVTIINICYVRYTGHFRMDNA